MGRDLDLSGSGRLLLRSLPDEQLTVQPAYELLQGAQHPLDRTGGVAGGIVVGGPLQVHLWPTLLSEGVLMVRDPEV
jgi:hypothetical protein